MSSSQRLLPWVQLPEVEFVRLIRESPISQVWEASQPALNRSVVVKIFDFSELKSKELDDLQLEEILGQTGYPIEVCPRVLEYGRADDFHFQILDFIKVVRFFNMLICLILS